MALAHAILVCLTEGKQSGYDVNKAFQGSIGFFWHSDHQRIYRELSKILKLGWVECELVEQPSKPNKKLYSLTQAGIDQLKEWAKKPSPTAPLKDDLLVRLFSLHMLDLAILAEQVRARREEHVAKLILYRKIQVRYYSDVDPTDARTVGKYLSLKFGMRDAERWIAWCDEALFTLDNLG